LGFNNPQRGGNSLSRERKGGRKKRNESTAGFCNSTFPFKIFGSWSRIVSQAKQCFLSEKNPPERRTDGGSKLTSARKEEPLSP